MKAPIFSAALLSSFCLLPSAFGQGALTPPGAPAPIMKSLAQIEPRTPVDAVHTPGGTTLSSGGIVTNLFIISQPGSYYLTTNVVAPANETGIAIVTNDVTLDLNGFSIRGNSLSLDGITIPFPVTNVDVHNGAIVGVGGTGIDAFGGSLNFTAKDLRISGVGGYGILCESGNPVVRNCAVSGNNERGIYFFSATGGVISDCVLKNTANSGIDLNGFSCLVINNNITGSDQNNFPNQAGILVEGYKNRVQGNHVTDTAPLGNGIRVSTFSSAYINNIILQNSVEGGGTNNYFFNTNQIAGPIITNAPSGIITNSNPWANFSF